MGECHKVVEEKRRVDMEKGGEKKEKEKEKKEKKEVEGKGPRVAVDKDLGDPKGTRNGAS